MNIVIFSSGYPTEKYLRNGQFAWDQAKIISSYHKVILMYVDLRSIRRIRKLGFSHKIANIDIIGYSFPIGRFPGLIRDFIGKKITKRMLIKLNEIYQYDVIHSHFLTNGYYLASNKNLIKAYFIHTEHSSALNKNNISKYVIKKMKITYSRVDRLVSVSKSIRNTIKMITNVNSIVIPNVIDFSEFRSISKGNQNNFTITCTARLVNGKGHEQLINVFSEFHKVYNDSQLILIGDGSLRPKLVKKINKLKLNNSIKITGIIPRNEINNIYLQSDCFILLTHQETFGLAVAEALSAGLPTISTNTGIIGSIINDDNGFLVDLNNHCEILDKLKYIKENSIEYDKTKISKKIKDKFSKEKFMSQLDNVYDEVIQIQD